MSRKDGKATLLNATVKKEIHQVSAHAAVQLSKFVAKSCTVNAIKVE
jgi:hypothetical protein